MSDLSRLEKWVKDHPFLHELAQLEKVIWETQAGFSVPDPVLPDWAVVEEDYRRGMPLLRSEKINLPVATPAGELTAQLIRNCTVGDVPLELRQACETMAGFFAANTDPGRQVAAKLLQDDLPGIDALATAGGVNPGLLYFFGWTALRRVLTPYLAAFDAWRDDDVWQRGYCPGCGALPVMAQLTKRGKGKERLLVCNCCGLKWGYPRIVCPYCATDDQYKLAILEPEEEEHFRLDVCKNCQSYIKTYKKDGNEAVALADWATLHLDVLGRERGYKKMGSSLLAL
ncbi:MAG: formate dehydrogenase accessory protein FdhE [Heliobacteriaceae bacterium]|nr:formate dehydrogenase accessory protein FdhE [Heliobacteriaceae bacterium]